MLAVGSVAGWAQFQGNKYLHRFQASCRYLGESFFWGTPKLGFGVALVRIQAPICASTCLAAARSHAHGAREGVDPNFL